MVATHSRSGAWIQATSGMLCEDTQDHFSTVGSFDEFFSPSLVRADDGSIRWISVFPNPKSGFSRVGGGVYGMTSLETSL